jgi:hypothetical protein
MLRAHSCNDEIDKSAPDLRLKQSDLSNLDFPEVP